MIKNAKKLGLTPWYKQKATWIAVSGICTAIGAYLTGEISIMVCIGSCFAGAATIAARLGIEKSRIPIHDLPSSERGEVLDQS
jgi:hypothetical protein